MGKFEQEIFIKTEIKFGPFILILEVSMTEGNLKKRTYCKKYYIRAKNKNWNIGKTVGSIN